MAIEIDYPFTVRPLAADEGGGYLLDFPDLPGCMADGETPEEAIREGTDALHSWLETHRELGQPIPSAASHSRHFVRLRIPRPSESMETAKVLRLTPSAFARSASRRWSDLGVRIRQFPL